MNLGQPGWRWCRQCEGMFFSTSTNGVCPAGGGQHDPSESGSYLLQLDESTMPGQDNWRWCRKCEGLFFNGASSLCPSDHAAHDPSASGNYILHTAPPAVLGQSDWRWCRHCGGLYFGGSPSAGVCPAGGTHVAVGSGDYRPRMAGDYAWDRTVFLAQYDALFGERLTPSQRAGLSELLTFMEHDAEITDLRWFAYMLATVKLECGNQYHPITELGCDDARTPVCTPIQGNPRSYGDAVPCPNLALRPPQPCPDALARHTYYGRGYVQITGDANYHALGRALGVGERFVHSPQLVLVAEASYSIMSLGMRRGLFTGRRLDQFINATTLDYRNARRIVNPGDARTFAPIAAFAATFQALLEVSMQ